MATYYYWTGSGVVPRANNTPYVTGATPSRMVPALTEAGTNVDIARKYVWSCTTAGTSGAAPPTTWPASVTPDVTTVTDGTVVWTARNPGYSSGSTVNWIYATIYFDYWDKILAAGDTLLVGHTSTENLTLDTTISLPANVKIISVNSSTNVPTVMDGTTYFIGNSSSNRTISVNGDRLYIYGIAFRTTGGSAVLDDIKFGEADNSHIELDSCYIWQGINDSRSNIIIGKDDAAQFGNANTYVKFKNCSIRFADAGSSILMGTGDIVLENCSLVGTTVTSRLFRRDGATGGNVTVLGSDLSLASGLVGTISESSSIFKFSQCRLRTGVTPLLSQYYAGKSGPVVYIHDCAAGNIQGFFGYYDCLGSCVTDSGIYFNNGLTTKSWKIVTTANVSYYTPFVTPFVSVYNSKIFQPIKPYFEILRDKSSVPFQNDEVWGEFFIKSTSGSSKSNHTSGRPSILSPATSNLQSTSNAANPNGWIGEDAVNFWSGRVQSSTFATPEEIGYISGRLMVSEPSVTLYLHPQVFTNFANPV